VGEIWENEDKQFLKERGHQIMIREGRYAHSAVKICRLESGSNELSTYPGNFPWNPHAQREQIFEPSVTAWKEIPFREKALLHLSVQERFEFHFRLEKELSLSVLDDVFTTPLQYTILSMHDPW
jgi:hypothetical protein